MSEIPTNLAVDDFYDLNGIRYIVKEVISPGNYRVEINGQSPIHYTYDEIQYLSLPVVIVENPSDPTKDGMYVLSKTTGRYIKQISYNTVTVVDTNTNPQTLNPVTNLALIYSSETVLTFSWTNPTNQTGITAIRGYKNGVLLGTYPITSTQVVLSGLTASTTYTFGVQNVGDNNSASAMVTASGTTQGAASTTPTLTVNTFGRTISGTTTNVESTRSVWIDIGGGAYGIAAPVQANGTWSVTLNTSEDYLAGQLFNPYVENEAAQSAQDPNGPFAYQTN